MAKLARVVAKSKGDRYDSTFVGRHRDVILLIITLIISFTVMVIFRTPHVGNISPFSMMQRGVATLRDTVDGIGLNGERIEELHLQYEKLLEGIDAYNYATQLSGYTQRDADQLNENLTFSSTLRFENILARVIARDPNQIFHAFTIDKGSRHGVEVDMPIIAIQDGLTGLVGRVAHVTNNSAIIQSILDDRNFVIAEHIETQLVGMLNGTTADNQILTLDLIDAREIERLQPRDLVTTSRFSSVYPPNIPIGTVRPFQRDYSNDRASVEVLPILNFNRLHYVFILLPARILLESTQ